MKILHLTDRWMTGGGQEHIYRVCQGLPGHHFVVMAGRDGPARGRFESLPNVETRTGVLSPKTIESIAPDIIHFHHLRPLLQWYFRCAARSLYPVVVTVHGLHVRRYDFQRNPVSRMKSWLRRVLENKLFHHAGMVIAVSREDREFLVDEYGLSNVETVFNGIPAVNLTSATATEVLNGLELPGAGLAALVPARFDFQKGHDILVKAVAHPILDKHRNRIVFLLAGDGPLRSIMEVMVMRSGVGDSFRFLGDCAHDTVLDMMRASDMVVLPSRWEGLPISLLEAGMLGKPVLASDACGNREILENQRGILFANGEPESLADELRGIIEDPSILEGYGAALRSHVLTEYSLERMVNSLEKVYADILSR